MNEYDAFQWEAPPLDAEDKRLIDAYLSSGRTLDDLPYTQEFEKLRTLVGADATDEDRHYLYRRLLRLRKMGRLPRLGTRAD